MCQRTPLSTFLDPPLGIYGSETDPPHGQCCRVPTKAVFYADNTTVRFHVLSTEFREAFALSEPMTLPNNTYISLYYIAIIHISRQ